MHDRDKIQTNHDHLRKRDANRNHPPGPNQPPPSNPRRHRQLAIKTLPKEPESENVVLDISRFLLTKVQGLPLPKEA